MIELVEEVKAFVEREYERASGKFGPVNNSSHESYAVLKEEADEARDESIQVEIHLDRYWKSVKINETDDQKKHVAEIYAHSILAACEFIQTAAMAHKAMATIGNKDSKTEQEEN